MYDVVAIGELLIDFTPAGATPAGAALFARNPGGAPANALASNTRLGGKTAFIGKVGNDDFGRFLKKTLDDLAIDTSGLIFDPEIPTTLAFVQLSETGDRSFSFYRKPGADILLRSEEVDSALIKNTHIMHFGSVSLTSDPSRSATLSAVRDAKEAGAIISYDPNYRPLLWPNPQEAVTEMKAALPLADIVKVSDEELTLLTGETDYAAGAKKLAAYGVTLILVTLGAQGAYYQLGANTGRLPAFDVKTVDTNGAGDSFTGAVHYQLRGKTLEEIKAMEDQQIREIVRFANAVGSITTTRSGAIPAMPTLAEVEALLRENP